MTNRYEANAFCTNCGYEGPVTPPCGQGVWTESCPVCVVKTLRPAALLDWERERWREEP